MTAPRPATPTYPTRLVTEAVDVLVELIQASATQVSR
jgi:hypothetical protein